MSSPRIIDLTSSSSALLSDPANFEPIVTNDDDIAPEVASDEKSLNIDPIERPLTINIESTSYRYEDDAIELAASSVSSPELNSPFESITSNSSVQAFEIMSSPEDGPTIDQLVVDGKYLGNGKPFPWAKYSAMATLVGTSVTVDILYTVFLAYYQIKSVNYVLELENNAFNTSIILGANAIGLLANLYCDLTVVPIAKEAAETTLAKDKFDELFEKHTNLNYGSKKFSKALYYASMFAAIPAYAALSTPDGVSLGIFTDNKIAIYSGCVVFGIAGTTYYALMLNPRRADHVVSFIDGLLNKKHSMIMDAITQPLMTTQALIEAGIVTSYRTLLAVFSIYSFMTETLEVKDKALNFGIAAAISNMLDVVMTRTKGPFVSNLKYRDLTFTKIGVDSSKTFCLTLEKGPLLRLTAEEKAKVKKEFSGWKMAAESLSSALDGLFIAALFYNHMQFDKVIGIGVAFAVHNFYAENVRRLCEAVTKVKDEAQSMVKELSLESSSDYENFNPTTACERAAKEKEEKFQEIIGFYKTKFINNATSFANYAARTARFVILPLAIYEMNNRLEEMKAYEQLGMDSLAKLEILALTCYLGKRYLFINEANLYGAGLKESNPEYLARFSLENNRRTGLCSKIGGFFTAIYKPAETYPTPVLDQELSRLKAAKAIKEANAQRPRTSMCERLFGKRRPASNYVELEPQRRRSESSRCSIM